MFAYFASSKRSVWMDLPATYSVFCTCSWRTSMYTLRSFKVSAFQVRLNDFLHLRCSKASFIPFSRPSAGEKKHTCHLMENDCNHHPQYKYRGPNLPSKKGSDFNHWHCCNQFCRGALASRFSGVKALTWGPPMTLETPPDEYVTSANQQKCWHLWECTVIWNSSI